MKKLLTKVVNLNDSNEIIFPVGERWEGFPVDPEKAPSYEEALRLLKEVDYLLNKHGPGSKKRVEEAKVRLRNALDFDVWTHNMLNPKAGLFPIRFRAKGSVSDPARETYHTM